jgi:hypothetical protein
VIGSFWDPSVAIEPFLVSSSFATLMYDWAPTEATS